MFLLLLLLFFLCVFYFVLCWIKHLNLIRLVPLRRNHTYYGLNLFVLNSLHCTVFHKLKKIKNKKSNIFCLTLSCSSFTCDYTDLDLFTPRRSVCGGKREHCMHMLSFWPRRTSGTTLGLPQRRAFGERQSRRQPVDIPCADLGSPWQRYRLPVCDVFRLGETRGAESGQQPVCQRGLWVVPWSPAIFFSYSQK